MDPAGSNLLTVPELHIIPINGMTGDIPGDLRAVALKISVTVTAIRKSAPGKPQLSGASFI